MVFGLITFSCKDIIKVLFTLDIGFEFLHIDIDFLRWSRWISSLLSINILIISWWILRILLTYIVSQIDNFITLNRVGILKISLILSHWIRSRNGLIWLILRWCTSLIWLTLGWIILLLLSQIVLHFLIHIWHRLDLSLHLSYLIFILIPLIFQLILEKFLLLFKQVILLLLYVIGYLTLGFYNPAIEVFIPNFAWS